MVNDPTEIMLDHLRALRASADRVEKRLTEHDRRFVHIERMLSSIRTELAENYELHADEGERMLSVNERIERLERLAGITAEIYVPA